MCHIRLKKNSFDHDDIKSKYNYTMYVFVSNDLKLIIFRLEYVYERLKL